METIGYRGITIKTIIGTLIAFAIGVQNLLSGRFFLEFIYSGSVMFTLIVGSLVLGLIGFIWFALFKMLLTDRGIVNTFIFLVVCILVGLFLGNSLIIATYWIKYFQPKINEADVYLALILAAIITFVVVIAGILILPKLEMTEGKIKFVQNASKIVISLFIVTSFLWLISWVLMLIGLDSLWMMMIEAFYGYGIVSIVISVVLVIFVAILFLATLALVKVQIGKAPKYQEYYYSAVLVNAIVRLFTEIFKLVLKVIARNK